MNSNFIVVPDEPTCCEFPSLHHACGWKPEEQCSHLKTHYCVRGVIELSIMARGYNADREGEVSASDESDHSSRSCAGEQMRSTDRQT